MSGPTADDLRDLRHDSCGRLALGHGIFDRVAIAHRGDPQQMCRATFWEVLASAWPAPVVDLEEVARRIDPAAFDPDASDEWFPVNAATSRDDARTEAAEFIAVMSWRAEAEVKAEALREAADEVLRIHAIAGTPWRDLTRAERIVWRSTELADEVTGVRLSMHKHRPIFADWLRSRADHLIGGAA